ncbi:hypothetical protein AK812_SmicGene28309 [Symbiodinium microadriaticum]|uniref:Uncharacterized protein n=1 Tax=Symbiodinium microadriaticum TaxID=2951 RepID=A0A1Q9D4W6_SYMMI|nr:hypothetical protein AK812_SmicGene28309 [Symbiodinium microadriaticum]
MLMWAEGEEEAEEEEEEVVVVVVRTIDGRDADESGDEDSNAEDDHNGNDKRIMTVERPYRSINPPDGFLLIPDPSDEKLPPKVGVFVVVLFCVSSFVELACLSDPIMQTTMGQRRELLFSHARFLWCVDGGL